MADIALTPKAKPVGRPRTLAVPEGYYEPDTVAARRAYMTEYKAQNAAALKAYYKAWRAANQDKHRQYSREWAARARERRALSAAATNAHQEPLLEGQRDGVLEQPEPIEPQPYAGFEFSPALVD